VQTFVFDNDFAVIARTLDNKRLGKQRVEAYQILNALSGKSSGWMNHPATRMWLGHEYSLSVYGAVMCEVWKERGFRDSLQDKFTEAIGIFYRQNTDSPWWLEEPMLHLTHKSNLVRKEPDWYQWDVPNNIPYIWAVPNSRFFIMGTIREGANTEVLNTTSTYLTSKQIAELLGVSPKTISAYKARGQMPKPDKQYGRTPLWKYSTIKEWRDELKTPIKGEIKNG
jgi:predicted DNA-binding transcriptional regulator AlpA